MTRSGGGTGRPRHPRTPRPPSPPWYRERGEVHPVPTSGVNGSGTNGLDTARGEGRDRGGQSGWSVGPGRSGRGRYPRGPAAPPPVSTGRRSRPGFPVAAPQGGRTENPERSRGSSGTAVSGVWGGDGPGEGMDPGRGWRDPAAAPRPTGTPSLPGDLGTVGSPAPPALPSPVTHCAGRDRARKLGAAAAAAGRRGAGGGAGG